jgi:hypothetical protein
MGPVSRPPNSPALSLPLFYVENPVLRSLGFTRDGEHVEPVAQGGERSQTVNEDSYECIRIGFS